MDQPLDNYGAQVNDRDMQFELMNFIRFMGGNKKNMKDRHA